MKTERFEMRLDRETLDRVDRWRAAQDDVPSRAEAVRRLVNDALTSSGKDELRVSGGDKLILMLLHRLFEALQIKGESDPEFVLDAIRDGHYWALEWKYPGLFAIEPDSPQVLREVVDVLEMWRHIEWGYSKLDEEGRARIETEAEPFGEHVSFRGFDGNHETEHLSIAQFLVEKLDRFAELKGRDLNSHMPCIDAYRRMLDAFAPMKRMVIGGLLGPDEIIDLLRAQMHPAKQPR